MDTKDLEVRTNKSGSISYWKDDVLVGKRCTVCGEDKEISEFSYANKKKGTYLAKCRVCNRAHSKKWVKDNPERAKEQKVKWYHDNLEKAREQSKKQTKKWAKNNPEKAKEATEKWRKNNPEKVKLYQERRKQKNPDYNKRRRENNPEYDKKWRENTREKISEAGKRYYQNIKKKKVAKITKELELINPILKQTGIKPMGSIYKITNIKTGRCYIGQTVVSLEMRYQNEDVINGWIKERKKKKTQKFTEELIQENLTIEIIDVGVSEWHLDKLEAHYIEQYDSYNNGYNNNAGKYNTNDGIEEFIQILEENNLEFIDNKIIKKRLPKQA